MHGRSIKIFLIDGTPTGLRTVEVGLSTIKALIAPRTAIEEIKKRDEVQRTGVYLLIGDDPDIPGRLALYVGEGDSVITRIVSHEESKDFWHTVIVFVSKDANLTKAHVRWLEARLVDLGASAKRATLRNGTSPSGGSLPESDQAEMNEFIDQIRLVLGTVGFDVFAPGTPHQATGASISSSAFQFSYLGDGFSAKSIVTGESFVVQKGSRARKEESPSLQVTHRTLRSTLISTGVLIAKNEFFEFTQDYSFNSPSQAAAVVSGTPVNGRIVWKRSDGLTYADWEKSASS